MITGRPIKISDAQIVSSSVSYPSTGETAWVTATAYAVGETVSYLIDATYHKFQCIQAHTSGPTNLPEAFPDDETNGYWIDLGAVNKYAPFQIDRNTQNNAPSPYVVEINPGERFTAVALGNVIADEVTIEVLNESDEVVTTDTKTLLVRDIYSWYDWLYQRHRQITKTIFSGLPAVSSYRFRLTFTRAAGYVRVGQIIPAVAFDIGQAQYAATVKRENFSTFVRDFDGEAKIKRRRNIPNISLQLMQDKSRLDGIKNIIDDLNSEVTFWSGIVRTTDGYFESLFAIGLYKDYSYSLAYPLNVLANIEIQEL
ncbi:hypothetical protein [Nitrosomonas oligotropha]|uniref:hypothetical protein n=1 Tax=Nitrosomonas oligotropha TaxID=42354 RepID=UPI00136F03F0|nr:hypothetical protein [Nitrosomonas oligotropha]MXS81581.1 hypothetical protein [Nitrosomonas oligotropha]